LGQQAGAEAHETDGRREEGDDRYDEDEIHHDLPLHPIEIPTLSSARRRQYGVESKAGDVKAV
jgi:hypothetical protein